jgi:hypothetical protein
MKTMSVRMLARRWVHGKGITRVCVKTGASLGAVSALAHDARSIRGPHDLVNTTLSGALIGGFIALVAVPTAVVLPVFVTIAFIRGDRKAHGAPTTRAAAFAGGPHSD